MNEALAARLRGLPPSLGPECRVLVLGSFPSALSLEAGVYYANPRNWFWAIAARALGDPDLLAPPLRDRPGRLLAQGIALWDVWASCERAGSLDSAIRKGESIDLAALLPSLPSLEGILLNGGEAASVFARRILPSLLGRPSRPDERPLEVGRPVPLRLADGRTCLAARMPSTSPVPSARFRTLEDRLAFWEAGLSRLGKSKAS